MKIGWQIPWNAAVCFLRNVQDLLSDGKTPYERRVQITFSRTDHSVWFIS